MLQALSQQRSHSLVRLALTDLFLGMVQWRIWLALSWQDFKTTYRRSALGVMWVSISLTGFIFIKLIIFSQLLDSADALYYSVYLASGIFIFQNISMSVSSSAAVFVSSEGWIKNDSLPLSIYIYKSVARDCYTLIFSSLALIAALIYLKYPPGPMVILLIPAAALFVLNAVWVKLLLGIICTRYRDIGHLIQTVMRMMLFLSPVIWLPETMGELLNYLWWNPVFHFIEIIRSPIIDQNVSLTSWCFVGVVTVVGWLVTIISYSLYRHRIVFWF